MVNFICSKEDRKHTLKEFQDLQWKTNILSGITGKTRQQKVKVLHPFQQKQKSSTLKKTLSRTKHMHRRNHSSRTSGLVSEKYFKGRWVEMKTMEFTNKLLCKLFDHIWVLQQVNNIKTMKMGIVKEEIWTCRRCKQTQFRRFDLVNGRRLM